MVSCRRIQHSNPNRWQSNHMWCIIKLCHAFLVSNGLEHHPASEIVKICLSWCFCVMFYVNCILISTYLVDFLGFLQFVESWMETIWELGFLQLVVIWIKTKLLIGSKVTSMGRRQSANTTQSLQSE